MSIEIFNPKMGNLGNGCCDYFPILVRDMLIEVAQYAGKTDARIWELTPDSTICPACGATVKIDLTELTASWSREDT